MKTFVCVNCGVEIRRPTPPLSCQSCGQQRIGLFREKPAGAGPAAPAPVRPAPLAALRLRPAPWALRAAHHSQRSADSWSTRGARVDSGRTGGATRRAAAASAQLRGSAAASPIRPAAPAGAADAARACGRITGTDGPREPRPANRFRPGSRGSAVARHAGSTPVCATAAVLRGTHAHGKRGAFGHCSIASAGSAAGLRAERACPRGCASAPACGETGIRSGWAGAVPRRARGSRLERAGA